MERSTLPERYVQTLSNTLTRASNENLSFVPNIFERKWHWFAKSVVDYFAQNVKRLKIHAMLLPHQLLTMNYVWEVLIGLVVNG